MNKILLVILCLLLINCGSPTYVSNEDAKPVGIPRSTVDTKIIQNCSVEKIDKITYITCPDGTIASIMDGVDGLNGTDGMDGEKGDRGENGTNGLDGKDGVDGANGTDGKDGINGVNGKDGVDGTNGIDGQNGKDGLDGKDGVDGRDGLDGKDGVDGRDAVNWTIFDPCKRDISFVDLSKPYYGLNEVLIKTNDGRLLGAIQEKAGSGYVAISEVVVDWISGWALGGKDGIYSCTFQFKTITINGETKKCTWFPNSAPTPQSFTDSNTTCW